LLDISMASRSLTAAKLYQSRGMLGDLFDWSKESKLAKLHFFLFFPHFLPKATIPASNIVHFGQIDKLGRLC